MDKRKIITKRKYFLPNGTPFEATIYRKYNNRGLSIRILYGEMEVYAGDSVPLSIIDKYVKQVTYQVKDRIVNRPFLKEGVYAYILGKKRYFTSDPANKNDPNFFYVPRQMKDPVTKYKAMFLEYLRPRVIELGKRMNRDLSDWKIRTGLFITYYGICFPTQHQMKFDYRLFAYKSEISDSVIIHEITHTYEIHHNARFYSIAKMYCPNYDELDHQIKCGYFEGKTDEYVY